MVCFFGPGAFMKLAWDAPYDHYSARKVAFTDSDMPPTWSSIVYTSRRNVDGKELKPIHF